MTSLLQTVNSTIQREIAFNSLCRRMAKDNVLLACNYAKSTLTGTLACPDPSKKITLSIGLKDRCINLIKAPLLLLRAPLLYLPITNRVTQLALRFLSLRKAFDFAISCPLHCYRKSELKIRYNKNALNAFKANRVKEILKRNIQENKEFDPSAFTDYDLLDAYIKLSPPLSIDLISSSEFKEDEVKARYSEATCYKFIEDYFKDKIAQKEKITKSDLDLLKDEETIFIKLGFTSQKCSNIFLRVLEDPSLQEKCSINLKKEINQYRKANQA